MRGSLRYYWWYSVGFASICSIFISLGAFTLMFLNSFDNEASVNSVIHYLAHSRISPPSGHEPVVPEV